jgi:hypothetical protein
MDGSCLESFTGIKFICLMVFNWSDTVRLFPGGNHFRFWNQVTTGAYFLAVSVEQWIGEHHNIVPDGYDIGEL